MVVQMNRGRGLVVDVGTILFWLLVVPAIFTVLVVALVPNAAALAGGKVIVMRLMKLLLVLLACAAVPAVAGRMEDATTVLP